MPDLKEFLESELDFIIHCQSDCYANLNIAYLHTQLGLIEAAQIYARNKIDQQTRTFVAKTQEDFVSFAERHTDGENTATGRSCSWANAVSSQNFNRDSVDDMKSYSERNLLNTAQRDESGYDLSCRHTWGHGFQYSLITHELRDKQGQDHGAGDGLEVGRNERDYSTEGGTGPLRPFIGTQWSPAFELTNEPPFVILSDYGPVQRLEFSPFLAEGILCDPDFNTDDDFEQRCYSLNLESRGWGVHGKVNWSVSLAIPGIGATTAQGGFEAGENERQYFYCARSLTSAETTNNENFRTRMDSETLADPSQNRSSSRETSAIYHLVRKFGATTRRGNTSTDAEMVNIGDSNGNSHAESQRQSKADAYQQRRAEQLTVSEAESHLRRTETARDDIEKRAYGQIPEQLSQMWNRVWNNLQILERQFASRPAGGMMNCTQNNQACVRLHGSKLPYCR